MTPTIDKEELLRIPITKRGRQKKKSELTGDGRLPSPVLSYTEIQATYRSGITFGTIPGTTTPEMNKEA